MSRNVESTVLPLGRGREATVKSSLRCVAKLTGTAATRVIVGLHGYGDNARNFSEVAPEMGVDDTLWVFPHAPSPVEMMADGGQWYDLFGPARAQVEESAAAVRDLLVALPEATGVPLGRTFLLGFSQGAYISLYTALRFEQRLAGVAALSGYLGQVHRTPPLPAHVKETPFFVAHGLHDNVVLPASHFETVDALAHWGVTGVTAKTYAMAHSLHPTEVADLRRFLLAAAPAAEAAP